MYNGDLDVPFDTWSQLLQSTPFPTGNEHGNAAFQSSNQYAFSYNSGAPEFAPAPPQVSAHTSGASWNTSLPSSRAGVSAPQYNTRYSADYTAPIAHRQPAPEIWSSTSPSAIDASQQENNPHWNPTFQAQQRQQPPGFDQQAYQQQFNVPLESALLSWNNDPSPQQYVDPSSSGDRLQQQQQQHQQQQQQQQQQSQQQSQRQTQQPNFNMGYYQPITRPQR